MRRGCAPPTGILRSVLVATISTTILAGGLVVSGAAFASFSTPTVNDTPAFASNITQLSAVLNGTINPEGIPTSYHFAYATQTQYDPACPECVQEPAQAYAQGGVIPQPDAFVPVNEQDDTVDQTLQGLLPGTTYHFALVADSPAGTIVGSDQSFTTPPVPLPAVLTGAASEIGLGTAAVSGSVDPHGWETGYHFEYGPTIGYGLRWPSVDVALGALTGAQPVIATIQNLQPGTLYHYRLAATDQAGTTYGQDQTFTTPEYPASIIQQAPLLTTPIGIPAAKPTATKPKTKPKHKPTHRHRRTRKRPRAHKHT